MGFYLPPPLTHAVGHFILHPPNDFFRTRPETTRKNENQGWQPRGSARAATAPRGRP